MPEILYALCATLAFASASIYFTQYSRSMGATFVNFFKCAMAFAAYGVLLIFMGWQPTQWGSFFAFMASGAVGLMLGDLFLLSSMKDIGASRVLMIFGLQPFLLGLGAFWLFDQSFSLMRFVGVGCMAACLFLMSLEKYKESGHWHLRGLTLGLLAILLDAVGILLTRYGFDGTPGLEPVEANFIRCFGALLGFFVLHIFYKPIPFKSLFSQLSKKSWTELGLASLGGTFLSLLFYLKAVATGHLSTISSVAVTGPLFATLFECLRHRKWPSPLAYGSLAFFAIGFFIFLYS